MGYRLNRLDEPVLIAVSKPLLTEFTIHQRLESCGDHALTLSLRPIIQPKCAWKVICHLKMRVIIGIDLSGLALNE